MNRRRMARLAGMALAAAGLAVSFASPVTASSDAMAPELLTAMQRDLGLSADQVYARVAQENTASNAETVLRDRLGGTFAGAWFDSSAGKLVVAVTDSSKVSQVSSAGATARVVARTAAQLDAQLAGLDAKASSAPSSVTGWYVDTPSNSVVATVLNSDPAGLAWVSRMGARSESTNAAPRPLWNVIGGQAITTGGARCSIAFSARSGSSRFVITAGHCTNIGASWSGVGGTLGTRFGTSFPGNDYGVIQVTSAAAVSSALVDRYNSGSDVTVAGSAQQSPRTSICRSGSTTGWRCGTIGAHNQTVNYPQGTVTGLTRTSACAQPGDSGGSFVSPNAANRVQAQGITSGGSGNCTTGGTTFHQPVNEVLGRFSLTLVTG